MQQQAIFRLLAVLIYILENIKLSKLIVIDLWDEKLFSSEVGIMSSAQNS
jgi:hypothetical protein